MFDVSPAAALAALPALDQSARQMTQDIIQYMILAASPQQQAAVDLAIMDIPLQAAAYWDAIEGTVYSDFITYDSYLLGL